jgi:hypothetical protein
MNLGALEGHRLRGTHLSFRQTIVHPEGKRNKKEEKKNPAKDLFLLIIKTILKRFNTFPLHILTNETLDLPVLGFTLS